SVYHSSVVIRHVTAAHRADSVALVDVPTDPDDPAVFVPRIAPEREKLELGEPHVGGGQPIAHGGGDLAPHETGRAVELDHAAADRRKAEIARAHVRAHRRELTLRARAQRHGAGTERGAESIAGVRPAEG